MGFRKTKIRGCVAEKWEAAGKPGWNLQRTIAECIKADDALAGIGLCPAPRFRFEHKSNNEKYLNTWVLGCHFPWLNPR